jgi:periplasmic protein TonB
MFSTLESNWDQSAHRGLTTLVSFTMQAIALSLLLLIPLFLIQGPPKLHWIDESVISPPTPAVPPSAGPRPIRPSNVDPVNIDPIQFTRPPAVPKTIDMTDKRVGAAPDLDGPGVVAATGTRGRGGTGLIDMGIAISPPPTPAPAHPLKLSHWSEGNLIYRVQPTYPSLARAARVQGAVELRAIISKTGTIESLVVVSGHPMLSRAAVEAVKQWRYRPYLLNNEPVEVETEITVNFVLGGS